MTQFLDVRVQPVGGGLAALVNPYQTTAAGGYVSLSLDDLLAAVRGRDVLIAAHGFNVNRADGINSLSNWGSLVGSNLVGAPFAFLGLLWPGDSVWAHGLDYPDEPKVADQTGALIGPFIDAHFGQAASVSFASHSLGARVVLSTIENMTMPVRRLTLMAGAIDDNCLNTEFQKTAAKIGTISVLSSRKDTVLSEAFPLGNFFAGIIAAGHPWWRGAIGRGGPVQAWPSNFRSPFEIPDEWQFNHGNYLEVDGPPVLTLPLPVDVPPQGAATPAGGAKGWQEAFTSAFEASRFR